MGIPKIGDDESIDYEMSVKMDYGIISLLTSVIRMVKSFGFSKVLKLGVQSYILGLPVDLPIMGVKGISEWREFDTRDPIMLQSLSLTSPLFPIQPWDPSNHLLTLHGKADVTEYYAPFHFKPLAVLDLKNAQFVMTPPINVGSEE